MKKDSPSIGEYIQQLVEEQNLNPTDFGKKINTTIQNVKNIYKRTTIDSDLLLTISQALNKNVFNYYSDKESIATFLKEESKAKQKEIEDLKEKIKQLQYLSDTQKELIETQRDDIINMKILLKQKK